MIFFHLSPGFIIFHTISYPKTSMASPWIPGLEEDDARSSVRWLLDACARSGGAGVDVETFEAWVQRRARREPVQYIVGAAASGDRGC